jgi:hypothetical protein
MKALSWGRAALLSLLAVAGMAFGGCGSGDANGPKTATQSAPGGDACDVADNWCLEHRVPEDVCAQCNAKVAAEYQKKGDWCKEHNRPESQCFLCNPKLADKFAAEYEAKYGKKPPMPEGQ